MDFQIFEKGIFINMKTIGKVILGLVLLAAICLWLLIEGRKNPKFLVWFIPSY